MFFVTPPPYVPVTWYALPLLVKFSPAVVDALKTLQDKIRRLELERKDAEKSYRQFSHDIQKQQEAKASNTTSNHGAAGLLETNNSGRRGKRDKKLRERSLCFTGVSQCFSLCAGCLVTVVSVFSEPELDSKLQSAEARCKSLEKQLDYMRKMVEKAKKERKAVIENQVVQTATHWENLNSLRKLTLKNTVRLS